MFQYRNARLRDGAVSPTFAAGITPFSRGIIPAANVAYAYTLGEIARNFNTKNMLDNATQKANPKVYAITSFIIGIAQFLFMFTPLLKSLNLSGVAWYTIIIVTTIVGVILGVKGMQSSLRIISAIGFAICLIFLLMFLYSTAIGGLSGGDAGVAR